MVTLSLQITLYSITKTLQLYFKIALTEWWKVTCQGTHLFSGSLQMQKGSINRVKTVSSYDTSEYCEILRSNHPEKGGRTFSQVNDLQFLTLRYILPKL